MISDRLAAIAYMVDKNKVVFDVGSDHGLLPCFLIESGIAKKVYAGDIAQGPLNHAIDNIKKRGLEDRITPVLSDGLDKCSEDVEVVVISGMGFNTIKHILDNCVINNYQYFVIQSNTDVDLLRRYISEHNFTIEDERIVFDDGFYYQIIKFSPDYNEHYSDIETKYGPILLKKRDHLFLQYLKEKHDKLLKINEKANKEEYCESIKEIEDILYN